MKIAVQFLASSVCLLSWITLLYAILIRVNAEPWMWIIYALYVPASVTINAMHAQGGRK